jgi:hypothetical protein
VDERFGIGKVCQRFLCRWAGWCVNSSRVSEKSVVMLGWVRADPPVRAVGVSARCSPRWRRASPLSRVRVWIHGCCPASSGKFLVPAGCPVTGRCHGSVVMAGGAVSGFCGGPGLVIYRVPE